MKPGSRGEGGKEDKPGGKVKGGRSEKEGWMKSYKRMDQKVVEN